MKQVILVLSFSLTLLATFLFTTFEQFSKGFNARIEDLGTQTITFSSSGGSDYQFLADYYFAIFFANLLISFLVYIRFNLITCSLCLPLISLAVYQSYFIFKLKQDIQNSEVYSMAKYFEPIRNTLFLDTLGFVTLLLLLTVISINIFKETKESIEFKASAIKK